MNEELERRCLGLFLKAVLCDSLSALLELLEILEAEG